MSTDHERLRGMDMHQIALWLLEAWREDMLALEAEHAADNTGAKAIEAQHLADLYAINGARLAANAANKMPAFETRPEVCARLCDLEARLSVDGSRSQGFSDAARMIRHAYRYPYRAGERADGTPDCY